MVFPGNAFIVVSAGLIGACAARGPDGGADSLQPPAGSASSGAQSVNNVPVPTKAPARASARNSALLTNNQVAFANGPVVFCGQVIQAPADRFIVCDEVVPDLAPLARLPRLRVLEVRGVKDLNQVALPQLESLTIGELHGDLAWLTNVPSVKRLAIHGAPDVTSLEALTALSDLTELVLWRSQTSDLSPVATHKNLETLDLHGNFGELSPLAELPLVTLSLQSPVLESIDVVMNLPALAVLNIDKTAVTDLRPLANLPIRSLSFHTTPVTDLSPLATSSELKTLVFSRTEVRDIRPLAGLAQLTFLAMHNTKVSDLRPLGRLAKLTRLEIADTPATDLRALAKLKSLERLFCMGVQAEDWKFLSKLRQLGFFRAERSSFRNLSLLRGLKKLYDVYVSGNQIPPAALRRFSRSRKDVRVTEL